MMKEARPYSGLQEVGLFITRQGASSDENEPMMEVALSTSAGQSKYAETSIPPTGPSTSAEPSTPAGPSKVMQVKSSSEDSEETDSESESSTDEEVKRHSSKAEKYFAATEKYNNFQHQWLYGFYR